MLIQFSHHLVLFIYLVSAIRIAIFKIGVIAKLYLVIKQGYLVIRSEGRVIEIPINKSISIWSIILRSLFGILFWPVDFIRKPVLMIKAYVFFDKLSIAQLNQYYAKTNIFTKSSHSSK